jgi:hypothetical protein
LGGERTPDRVLELDLNNVRESTAWWGWLGDAPRAP